MLDLSEKKKKIRYISLRLGFSNSCRTMSHMCTSFLFFQNPSGRRKIFPSGNPGLGLSGLVLDVKSI